MLCYTYIKYYMHQESQVTYEFTAHPKHAGNICSIHKNGTDALMIYVTLHKTNFYQNNKYTVQN